MTNTFTIEVPALCLKRNDVHRQISRGLVVDKLYMECGREKPKWKHAHITLTPINVESAITRQMFWRDFEGLVDAGLLDDEAKYSVKVEPPTADKGNVRVRITVTERKSS